MNNIKTKKRILCCLGKSVFQTADYTKSQFENFGQYGGNTGNFLFNYALEQYLTNKNTETTFIQAIQSYTPDFINNNFDMILFSSANFLNPKCKGMLQYLADTFKKIKIPCFFIGIGIQAELSDAKFNTLSSIDSEIKQFISSVYNAGGSFSLRGHKTAEFFEKLGFNNYTVTGCPSMFIQNRDFKISHPTINANELNPMFNGLNNLYDKHVLNLFNTYPKSVFIDQDRFYRILFCLDKHPIKYSNLALRLRFNKETLELLNQKRIKLFSDIPVWANYIKENKFNFSFGSRIHGNIIAILNDIPAFIQCRDQRVLELAEFFEIPHTTKNNAALNLFEIYQNLDYTNFNKNYAQKYDNFQNFFDKHNIPCILGKNEEFENLVANLEFISP